MVNENNNNNNKAAPFQQPENFMPSYHFKSFSLQAMLLCASTVLLSPDKMLPFWELNPFSFLQIHALYLTETPRECK